MNCIDSQRRARTNRKPDFIASSMRLFDCEGDYRSRIFALLKRRSNFRDNHLYPALRISQSPIQFSYRVGFAPRTDKHNPKP
jgi:hypothetical protein